MVRPPVQNAVGAVVESLQTSSAEGVAATMAERKDDMSLVLSSAQGRGVLASVLSNKTNGGGATASFPTAGFEQLCVLVELALSEMTGTVRIPIFDVFVIAIHGAKAGIVHHVDFPRQQEGMPVPLEPGSGKPRNGNPPGGVEHFCFPVDPAVAPPPPNYTIVRTLDDGSRQYGFCRSVTTESGEVEVLCLLSRHPWFTLFESVMWPLAEARTASGYSGADRLLDALFDYASAKFPMPGERFKVEVPGGGGATLFLTRPSGEQSPLDDVDCADLFRCIGVAGVLAMFKAMLVEGHCVFVSADFHRLGLCVQAAASLLYPFTWQHIFVPILPYSWMDYITAPMPFIFGVHSTMLDEVLVRLSVGEFPVLVWPRCLLCATTDNNNTATGHCHA